MQTLFTKIISIVTAPLLAIGAFFAPTPPPAQQSTQLDLSHLESTISRLEGRLSLIEHAPAYSNSNVESLNAGATNAIPDSVALFETSLASAITSTQATMTLVSALDKTGTALASSTYAFIIDEGTASEEMVIADCTSTACTNMTRGISPTTGTTTVSALQKAHRRGASVKITDGPQLVLLTRILNGIGNIPNKLRYATAPTFTSGNELITKTYADNLAFVGAPDSSLTVKGVVERATGAQAAAQAATGSGDTTAPLALTTDISTSTCQATGNSVIVTPSDGKITATCLDLTEPFAFTSGSTTLQNFTGVNATTTNATTTTFAFSSGKVNAGNIHLEFQGTQPASSTIPSPDADGKITFLPSSTIVPAGTFLGATTTDTSVNDTITETSLGAGNIATIAAGALGTNGGVHARMHVSAFRDTAGSNESQATFRLKLGGTTVCSIQIDPPTTVVSMVIDFFFWNTASASAQACITTADLGIGTGTQSITNIFTEGTSAINTASSLGVTATAQWDSNDAGDTEALTMDNLWIVNEGR